MKVLFYSLIILLYYFYILQTDAYRDMRFSKASENTKKDISQDLKNLASINEELINNEKEEEEEEDSDESDEDKRAGFDELAHQALEHAEEEGVVDLENAEIEALLDNELYKIIQERLKKLWYIGKCRRNYSSLCPLQWKTSAYDDNLCVPPKNYEGQCRSIDFSNTTDKEKENFAWRCEVEWPCVSAPKMKLTGKCPIRWTNVGQNLCIAPEDYVGECSPAIDFSNFNFEMRARMAIQCDFEWPVEPKKDNVLKYDRMHNAFGGPVEESGDVKKVSS